MLAGEFKAVWKAEKEGCNWWESPWGKERVWCGGGRVVEIQCHYCSQVWLYVTVKLIAVPIPPLALLFLPFPLLQIWHCCCSSLNWFCSLSQWKTSSYCFQWGIFHQISSTSLCAYINCQICSRREGMRMPGHVTAERRLLWNGSALTTLVKSCTQLKEMQKKRNSQQYSFPTKKGKTKPESPDDAICCSASDNVRWTPQGGNFQSSIRNNFASAGDRLNGFCWIFPKILHPKCFQA